MHDHAAPRIGMGGADSFALASIVGGMGMSSMREPDMPVISRVPRWNVA